MGKIPSVWKHAYIAPIQKNDSKEMVENYRPISLLNNVSKVMERLVFNHVYPVIENVLVMLNMDLFTKGQLPQISLTCMVRLVRRLIKEGKQM